MFGEKMEEENENIVTNGKKVLEGNGALKANKRLRGWFPRQCAAEFFEDNESDPEVQEEQSKKKK